jgi:integrase/recombinase XerD
MLKRFPHELVQEFVSESVRVIDDRERVVVGLWRKGHLSRGTIVIYLYWVRRFRKYCERRGLLETEQLTVSGVDQFLRAYVGPRLKRPTGAQNSRTLASNALHAWACALDALGTTLPLWKEKQIPQLPALLEEYYQYRRAHNGVAESTLVRDLETARGFLAHLRLERKSIEQATLTDIDAFVKRLASRLSKRTTADACSSLRAFLRFLQMTGRLTSDLACGVIAPRYRIDEHPPRTLPWKSVQRILRSISRSEAPGKRDFAIVLLLATYGLGAAEVLALRLDDLDWQAGILRVRRPKTNVLIEVPLLPAVAKALTAYLRWERPPARSIHSVFLRKNMPYEPMTSAAIRYRIRHYAGLAGISAKVIGAHAFRHSHASRQIDSGANIKVVGDILGHRRPSSTSVYVRVALKRLRTVALPVPR